MTITRTADGKMFVPASQVSRFEQGTPKAMERGKQMEANENNRGSRLQAQYARPNDRFIFLYNILRGWDFPPVQQPPTFPNFKIPSVPAGEDFAFTLLSETVNELYAKPGTDEVLYITRPGTEAANSLVNPDQHPGNPWDAQFRDIRKFGNGDMGACNLNELGVWWSWTEPDDPKLIEEINRMRKRVDQTMKALINEGNTLNLTPDGRTQITPLHHFAMDYFHLQSKWHESMEHLVPCPNCQMPVRQGIAYHKNEFGDRCIIDRERYEAAIELSRPKRREISTQAARQANADPASATPPAEGQVADPNAAEVEQKV
jgi:hypothetical protein